MAALDRWHIDENRVVGYHSLAYSKRINMFECLLGGLGLLQ
ncbi:hypothetical protein EC9_27370 [Rosistilla ulvae]|uniref:Uncharacterized protein n=1 Tax=Rosistilla ulvae TaxID=1930277 RepID=A0A517M113_9BACT|nr:hypothetical protein EC9_27370 [Rosistilla ulvae]